MQSTSWASLNTIARLLALALIGAILVVAGNAQGRLIGFGVLLLAMMPAAVCIAHMKSRVLVSEALDD